MINSKWHTLTQLDKLMSNHYRASGGSAPVVPSTHCASVTSEYKCMTNMYHLPTMSLHDREN